MEKEKERREGKREKRREERERDKKKYREKKKDMGEKRTERMRFEDLDDTKKSTQEASKRPKRRRAATGSPDFGVGRGGYFGV